MDLKKETKEFTLLLRAKLIGNTAEANANARDTYVKRHGEISQANILENISSIISQIFIIQRETFEKAIQEIESNWINYVLDFSDDQHKFSTYVDAPSKINSILDSTEGSLYKTQKLLGVLAPIQSPLSFSNKQAGKTRGGSALESHLEYLFNKLNMKFDTQKTPLITGGGEKFDFIFPDIERFERISNDCMLCEAQATLKDRFRLTQGKAQTVPTNKYLFTAGGAGIVRANDTVNDFTLTKLDELQSKDVTLVVLKEVKEDINHPIMRSYEEFVGNEYPTQEMRWDA